MESVTAGPPGWVAVGWTALGRDIDAAVWTSEDGTAWLEASDDGDALSGTGPQAMSGVSAGTAGLVAVGWDASGGDQDGAVWTSADGSVWTRARHDEDVFGGPGDQWMFAVATGGPRLVAVGQDNSGGDQDAAVWTSADGSVWSRVRHDEGVLGGPAGQAIFGVTSGGPGLVAVGWDASGGEADAAVWTSPDGVVWSRVPHDEAVFGGAGDQEILGVLAVGSGLVAVGWDSSGGDQDAAVWTSTDGSIWERVPHDEDVFGGAGDQETVSVTMGGPGLVAVGWDSSGGDQDAAVWTSTDGSVWERVSHNEEVFGGGGDQWILGVVGREQGIVAVGWDTQGGEPDAAVWVAESQD